MNNLLLKKMEMEFCKYMYSVARRSDKTVKGYHYDLSKFISFMEDKKKVGASDIKREDIEKYLATIPRPENGSTANYNRKVSSLRSFFKFLERNGLAKNPVQEFKPTKNHVRQISYLNESEKQKFFKTVREKSTPFYKARDLAIISLFLNSGIRVGELVNIEAGDLDFRKEDLSYIKVRRKGGSEDSLPIGRAVAERIGRYLEKRKDIPVEKVFLSKTGKPLKSNSVYYLVKKYLMKAGIKKKKMGPHILRHTVGVSLLKKGVDLVTIQKILGHKRLETTSIYLHIEPKDMEKAVELIAI